MVLLWFLLSMFVPMSIADLLFRQESTEQRARAIFYGSLLGVVSYCSGLYWFL